MTTRVGFSQVNITLPNGDYLYFADKKSFDSKAYEASSSIIKRGKEKK